MPPLNDKKQNGRTYWRSLDELEGSADFQEYVHREFPEGASELSDPFSRRGFMKAMAASFALAGGLVGCRRPEEKIMPYSDAPEDVIPGKSFNIATSAPRSRGSLGLLVRSSEGRPTKIEGLPNHPANNGSTDSMAQADLLDLYNPFRQKSVKIDGKEADFSNGMNNDYRMASRKNMKALESKLADIAKNQKSVQGAGLAFLSTPVTSPTQLKVMGEVREAFPNAKWYSWEALNDDNSAAAVKYFTGTEGYDNQVIYDLSKAKRILALDSDFMMNERNSVKMLQDYADRRRIYRDAKGKYEDEMSTRFYAVESAFSVTGSNADHRLRLKSSKITDFIFALAKKIAAKKDLNPAIQTILKGFNSNEKFTGKLNAEKTGADFIDAVAEDLIAAGKESVIIVGERQPASVHLLALVINQVLGNIGSTVKFVEKAAKSVTFTKDNFAKQSISRLSADLDAKSIETLFILDGNPVYDAPADAKLAEKIKNVKEIITLALFPNETTDVSTVVVPKSHYLESWGDTRAYDGTISFVQPLIAPLFSSLTETELLSKLLGKKASKAYQAVKDNYTGKNWDADLQKGFISDSAFKAKSVKPNWGEISHILKGAAAGPDNNSFELIFAPDYSTYDGRYNNNGWMQELPDPITKLTWDNAVLMSYGTANNFVEKLKNRDLVTITAANGAKLTAPVWVVPGMPDNTVQVTLGYGRTSLGEEKGDREYVVFSDTGFNAYPLRTTDHTGFTSCEIAKASGTYDLVTTQDHWAMEDRDLVKEVSLSEFDADFKGTVKKKIEDQYHTRSTDKLYSDRKEFAEAKYQWAMVIDLNSCVGCSAFTIACQAENNIPVVGKERVSEGREMHWIRMDRYFYSGRDSEVKSDYTEPADKKGDAVHDIEVGALHQPIPCMQCEEAPCEQVCPVAATQHSPEGLNDMVYNRCIGTRYCLNNCPYKVRRFNYFNFQEDLKKKNFEVKKMVHNPSVSVRSRGVMEKCTYCVQRINEAKIDAKVRKDESIIDKFTTACAQVCPTKAITFGDKNNEKSAVSKMRKESRNYTLLPHLNVRPRTSFLSKVTDTNVNLVAQASNNSGKGEH
ncbi:MAG: TAT-variant-translocated molybdopterin oxidoreductase [Lentisphaeraceae bacterium]|nr:TAT-variant-translocated molybdopterin oxidoreductase [Lentisphaeraceae bacterium]